MEDDVVKFQIVHKMLRGGIVADYGPKDIACNGTSRVSVTYFSLIEISKRSVFFLEL